MIVRTRKLEGSDGRLLIAVGLERDDETALEDHGCVHTHIADEELLSIAVEYNNCPDEIDDMLDMLEEDLRELPEGLL